MTTRTTLLACLLSVLPASLSSAGEPRVIRTPFFTIELREPDRPAQPVAPPRTGGPLQVDVVPYNPQTSAPGRAVLEEGPAILPGAVEELPPPAADPAPLVTPAPSVSRYPSYSPAPVRYPTMHEFIRSFRPAAGNYEVVLIHPSTHHPVRVAFTLPYGQPRKVRLERDEFEYDYGKFEVEVEFKRDGRVTVDYDD
jgi:hypothetical protein